MERAEGLLGGKSLFKSQNDGTIDKTEVVCSICQAEFCYPRSSSSLSYHLNAVVLKLFLSFPTLNKGAFSSPTCPSSLPCNGRSSLKKTKNKIGRAHVWTP